MYVKLRSNMPEPKLVEFSAESMCIRVWIGHFFWFSAVSLLHFSPLLLLFDRHNLFLPSGNYSCMPTNAEGTSAIVHVINGKWTRVCDSGLLLASLFSLSVNPFFRLIFMELGVVIAFIIPFFPLCFVRCVSVCVCVVGERAKMAHFG